MSVNIQNQLLVKLFVGCTLTSEIRMHLNESRLWNQAQVAPRQERDLIETRFQQQEYLGRFLNEKELAIPELKEIEKGVRSSIESYCPKLNSDRLSFCVFPQLFLP